MEDLGPPPVKKACPDNTTDVLKTCPTNEEDVGGANKRFAKRRKFGVLLSYSGRGYMGMQKNPGVRTIEEDLLVAMSKAKAFPEDMVSNLGQLHFQRCARTDKGVSASRQLVSIKIRVMAVKRVTKSFDSHHACTGRMYEYILPTYAFASYHLTTANYRIPDDVVMLVDKLAALFIGTHNFHNFTSGKKFKDMSSNRYIMSFTSGPKFIGTNTISDKEMEFIPLRVKGQSFVLHQIRKMIGFIIAVARGHASEEEFDKVFKEEKVDIPKAPALGLLLENVYFERYNAKFANSGERERLEWEDVKEEIEAFKMDHIYKTIIDTEIKDMIMMKWLHTLQLHHFHETAERLKAVESAQSQPTKSESTTDTISDPTDTANTISDPTDTANTMPDPTDTANTMPDPTDTANTMPDPTDTANTMPDPTDTANTMPDPTDTANTMPDPTDTANTMPDPTDTANTMPDPTDTANTMPDPTDTANTMPDPTNTANTISDPTDTANTISDINTDH